jgi:hypothetical protein
MCVTQGLPYRAACNYGLVVARCYFTAARHSLDKYLPKPWSYHKRHCALRSLTVAVNKAQTKSLSMSHPFD